MNGKKFTGVVKKISGINTVKVEVVTLVTHPKYFKIIRRHKNYLCHSIIADLKVDSVVDIAETKPVSKAKKFVVTSVRKIIND
jgi:ribosomal protein S17